MTRRTLLVLVLAATCAVPGMASAVTATVDCSTGRRLAPVVAKGRGGLTIVVKGTRNENVVIGTDGLRLRGETSGTSAIQGLAADRDTVVRLTKTGPPPHCSVAQRAA